MLSEMNRRVTIHRATQSQDAEGNILWDFQPAETVWAKIEPYQPRIESGSAWQMDEVLYRITMRRRNIGAKDKLVCGDKKYEQILPPMDIDRKYTLLTVKEILP